MNLRSLNPIPRRTLLRQTGAGLGSVALTALIGHAANPVNPLAVKPPHFAPRARRVIFLFMHGGPSHVDTFDPKARAWRPITAGRCRSKNRCRLPKTTTAA